MFFVKSPETRQCPESVGMRRGRGDSKIVPHFSKMSGQSGANAGSGEVKKSFLPAGAEGKAGRGEAVLA